MVDDLLYALARDLGELEQTLAAIGEVELQALGLDGFRQESWPAAREVVIHYTDGPKEAGR